MIKTLLFSILLQISTCFILPKYNLPYPIFYFGITSVENPYYNGLIVAGGIDSKSNIQYNILKLSFTNNWEQMGNLSIPRMKVNALSVDEYSLLFLAGGSDSQNNYYDRIDIYNFILKKFTTNSLTHKYQNISSDYFPDVGIVFFSGVITFNPPFSGLDIYNIQTNITVFVPFPGLIIPYMVADKTNKKVILFGVNFQTNKEYILFYDIYTNKTTNFFSNANHILSINGITYLPDNNLIVAVMNSFLALLNLENKNISFVYIPVSINKYSIPQISYNGLIFLAGGIDLDGSLTITPSMNVQIYDVNTGVWSSNSLGTAVYLPAIAYIKSIKLLLFIGEISSFVITSTGANTEFSVTTNGFPLCRESMYSSTDFLNCLPCPAGFFCPAGSYQVEIDSSIPYRICPQGSYCPANSSNVTNCLAGTYNSNFMSISISDCLNCPSGTFNIFAGQKSITNCVKCQMGTICKEKSIIPMQCPSHYYCPSPMLQIPCPSGTYFSGSGATAIDSCVQCLQGSFCPGNGEGASPCQAGSYSDKLGNSKCENCPAGYSCSFGASLPQPCPINYYASSGSSACTPCSNGQFTTEIGSSTCMSCPSSRFTFDGWWCMNTFEKLVFLGVWIGSITSGGITLWKIYSFIKIRINQIREEGYKPTLKTFIFLEKMNRRNINLTDIVEQNPILEEDQLKKINEIISELKEKIILIESKN